MSNQTVNIREAFQARPGYYYIDPDYSQIEFRLSAALAGERELMKGFIKGHDYYKSVYVQMSAGSATYETVTKLQRGVGKVTALGQNYGQGKYGLARKLGCDVDTADGYMDAYWGGLAGTKNAKEIALQRALQDGYVTTWFGRRRYLPELFSDNRKLRGKAVRSVWNTLIQGLAADWMKIAMLRCYRALRGRDVHTLLTVHDELLFEASEKEPCLEISAIIEEGMEFKVPNLPVNNLDLYPDGFNCPINLEYGYDWGTLYTLDDFREFCAQNGKPVNFDAPRPEGLAVSFISEKNAEPRIQIKPRPKPPKKDKGVGVITLGKYEHPIDAIVGIAAGEEIPTSKVPQANQLPLASVVDVPAPVAVAVTEAYTPPTEEVVQEKAVPKPSNGTNQLPPKDDYAYPCVVVSIEDDLNDKQKLFLKALLGKYPGTYWVYVNYQGKVVRAGQRFKVDPKQEFTTYLKKALGERTSVVVYDSSSSSARGRINFA